MDHRYGMVGALSVLAACASPMAACAQASPTPPQGALATIQDTDQFVVHSKIANADFLIQVAKPILTAPQPLGQTWPATYVLDGTYLFGMVTPVARLLPFERAASATYVVGVGFPETAFMAYGQRRNHDLMHRVVTQQNGQAMGGGGSAFERFLREELRPLIESRYPVDPTRAVLAGHSLGGLFTATVLAEDPTAFWAYMIGSPSLQFDPNLATRIRATAAKGGGRRVLLSVGEKSDVPLSEIDALEAALRSPGSTLVVARKTLADETHVSSQGAFISAGLRHVLPPAAPK